MRIRATLASTFRSMFLTRFGRGGAAARMRPARMRSALGAVPAVAALLTAIAAIDAIAGGRSLADFTGAPRDATPRLASLLRRSEMPAARRDSDHAPLEAYLVTSSRDCASNLGALDLLARETIAPRIRLVAALVTPSRHHGDRHTSVADSTALRIVRETVAAHDLPMPPPIIRTLDAPTEGLLRAIGYRSTPFLVVLDSAGRLRFGASSSRSFAEYQELTRALTALAAQSR